TTDADEIARIQLTTWRTAYRRLLPRHVLADLDAEWIAAQWRDGVEKPPSPRDPRLVAIRQAGPPPPAPPVLADRGPTSPSALQDREEGDEPRAHTVGFAATGPADEEALAPDETPLADSVAAVTDLLVEPRWGRRGHGSRLLAAAVDGWREDSFDTAV